MIKELISKWFGINAADYGEETGHSMLLTPSNLGIPTLSVYKGKFGSKEAEFVKRFIAKPEYSSEIEAWFQNREAKDNLEAYMKRKPKSYSKRQWKKRMSNVWKGDNRND